MRLTNPWHKNNPVTGENVIIGQFCKTQDYVEPMFCLIFRRLIQLGKDCGFKKTALNSVSRHELQSTA